MKRLISIILCIAIVLTSMAFPSFAANNTEKIELSSLEINKQIEELTKDQDYKEGSVIAFVKQEKNGFFEAVGAALGGESDLIDSANLLMPISSETYSEVIDDTGISRNGADNATSAEYNLVSINSEGLSTKELLKELLADERVIFAEPNYINTVSGALSDALSIFKANSLSKDGDSPEYEYVEKHEVSPWMITNPMFIPNMTNHQWIGYVNNSGIPYGWNSAMPNANGKTIALIIDTGIDYYHPDLYNLMYHIPGYIQKQLDCGEYGVNFVKPEYETDKTRQYQTDPYDNNEHGTHCAGIVASSWNKFGTSGVANGVKLVAAKGLSAEGSGDSEDLIKCFKFAYDLSKALEASGSKDSVKVINYSIGGSGLRSMAFNLVFKQLATYGIVVCKASGNEHDNSDFVTGDTTRYSTEDNVIVVDAMEYDPDSRNQIIRAPFTNYGLTTDVFAPGVRILSTVPRSSKKSVYTLHDIKKDLQPVLLSGRPFVNVPISAFSSDENQGIYSKDFCVILDAISFAKLKEANYLSLNIDGDDQLSNDDRIELKIKGTDSYINPTGRWAGYQDSPEINISLQDLNSREFNWGDACTQIGNKYSLNLEISLKLYNSNYEDVKNKKLTIRDFSISEKAYPYDYFNGTSMATPFVTGAVAVMYQNLLKEGKIKNLRGSDRTEEAKLLANTIKASVTYDKDFDGFCSQNGSVNLQIKEVNYTPVINRVKYDGNFITIEGAYFGSFPGEVKISAMGESKEAKLRVISWTNSEIKLSVGLAKYRETDMYKLTVTKTNGKFCNNYVKFNFGYHNLFEKDCKLTNDIYDNTAFYSIQGVGDKVYIMTASEMDNYFTSLYEYDTNKNITTKSRLSNKFESLHLEEIVSADINDSLWLLADEQAEDDSKVGLAFYEFRNGHMIKHKCEDDFVNEFLAETQYEEYVDYYSYSFHFGKVGKNLYLFENVRAVDQNSYIITGLTFVYKLNINHDGSISASMLNKAFPLMFTSFATDGTDAYLTGIYSKDQANEVVIHFKEQGETIAYEAIMPFAEETDAIAEGLIIDLDVIELKGFSHYQSKTSMYGIGHSASFGIAVADGQLWISGLYDAYQPELTRDGDAFILKDGKFMALDRRVSANYASDAVSTYANGYVYTMFSSIYETVRGKEVSVYMRGTKAENEGAYPIRIDLDDLKETAKKLAVGTVVVAAGTVATVSAIKEFVDSKISKEPINIVKPNEPEQIENKICPRDNTCVLNQFSDLDANAWYHDGIEYAVNSGLMNGMTDIKFTPDGKITRPMMMTILARMDGCDTESGSSWAETGKAWAKSNGVSEGIAEEGNITREEFATMLYRYAKLQGEGFKGDWMFLLNYKDADKISEFADEAMHWCVMKGILNGKAGLYEDMLDPQGELSRAEAAAMIQRFADR